MNAHRMQADVSFSTPPVGACHKHSDSKLLTLRLLLYRTQQITVNDLYCRSHRRRSYGRRRRRRHSSHFDSSMLFVVSIVAIIVSYQHCRRRYHRRLFSCTQKLKRNREIAIDTRLNLFGSSSRIHSARALHRKLTKLCRLRLLGLKATSCRSKRPLGVLSGSGSRSTLRPHAPDWGDHR